MLHRLCLSRRRITTGTAVAAAALTDRRAYTASTSVSAKANEWVVTTTQNTNRSTTGGSWTPVITLQLPSSSSTTHYVFAAQGDSVNFGPSDDARCQILNGTQAAAPSPSARRRLTRHTVQSQVARPVGVGLLPSAAGAPRAG
jgi:hypothetical protein